MHPNFPHFHRRSLLLVAAVGPARRQSTKVADICRRVIDTDYVPD